MSQDAFPLSWPASYPRTKNRQGSRFGDCTFASSRDGLMNELDRMGASRVVLSTNIPLKRDGLPYANAGRVADPGVAVYFQWRQKPRVLACDRWTKIEDNMHAVELTVAAMRGLERWGASDILERAFTGLTALPAAPEENWETILGVHKDWRLDAIEEKYRDLMLAAHPDRGGSVERAQKLNRAIAQARAAKAAA